MLYIVLAFAEKKKNLEVPELKQQIDLQSEIKAKMSVWFSAPS